MPTSDQRMTAADARALARAIAEHLEPGWVEATNPEFQHAAAELKHDDGRALFLYADSYRNVGRVEISGSYPRPENGEDIGRPERHEITASLTRGPEAIAKDITRRLLPAYNATFAEQTERVSSAEAAHRTRLELAEKIAQQFPGASVDDDRHGRTSVRLSYLTDGPYGSAEINYHGETGTLELRNVPAGRLAAVIAAALG